MAAIILAAAILASCSNHKTETKPKSQLILSVMPVGASGTENKSAFADKGGNDAQTGIMSAEAADAVRQAVIDGLLQNSKKSRYRLVDTRHIEKIVEQHQFEAGPWSAAEKVADIDKELNAQVIAILSAVPSGSASGVNISVSLLNVNTMEMYGRADAEVSGINSRNPNTGKLLSAVKNMKINF